MDDFFIDKLGNNCEDKEDNKSIESEDSNGSDEFLDSPKLDLLDALPVLDLKEDKLKKKKGYSLNDTYLVTSYKNKDKEEKSSKIDKLLEKSVLVNGLEQFHSIPVEKQKKILIKERRKLREKTKGKKWFDMPATKITKEIKTDFELLKMRSILDKKHVYKKNDITRMPKYFQVGRVIESPADFYSGRIPKTQRKMTFVDELMADAEFKNYQKKKFKEIMDENRRKKKHSVKKSANKKGQKKKEKS